MALWQSVVLFRAVELPLCSPRPKWRPRLLRPRAPSLPLPCVNGLRGREGGAELAAPRLGVAQLAVASAVSKVLASTLTYPHEVRGGEGFRERALQLRDAHGSGEGGGGGGVRKGPTAVPS